MPRWTLIVSFDTLADIAKGGNSETVLGEDGDFITELTKMWSLHPEDLDEDITWNGTTVTAQADVLDYLVDAVRWVMMTTIPQHIELTRNEDRNP